MRWYKILFISYKRQETFSSPSKHSTNHILQVNSDIPINNSCVFEFVGIDINFSSFPNNFISVSFNLHADKLICASHLVISCCVVVDFGTKNYSNQYKNCILYFGMVIDRVCHFHELHLTQV